MTAKNNPDPEERLAAHLAYLKLSYTREHFEQLAQLAAKEHWSHVRYLCSLMEGEANLRQDRSIQRRINLARFPVIKT